MAGTKLHPAAQILAAWRNEHRPARTTGAKIRDAIDHARATPLRLMLEIERQRRVGGGVS